MNYRTLGESDLSISEITFGAWAAGGWMWGGTERKTAVEAIHAALDVGMTSIDTAPIYGQGLSEEIVGEAISGHPRDQIQILTKFGMRWDEKKGVYAFSTPDAQGSPIDIYKYAGKESVVKECENSLRRLKTDYIDLYQIHWPDSSTPLDETFEAAERLLDQGKIRAIGVCNYDEVLMGQLESVTSVVSNQIPFSMVNRAVEEKTVPYCIEHNKSVLAYSPLERGLLTGKITPNYTFKAGDHRASHPHFQPDFVQRTNTLLDKIKPIAFEHQATLAQLILRWTIDRPGMTIALAGARNSKQTIENAQAAALKLTAEDLRTIDSAMKNFDREN